ncbi:MAG: hypothetical protein KDA78_16925 [Planctomycetaceae bacterium]|nr:hypothetical protein [Planctomycetaceae bacterium]
MRFVWFVLHSTLVPAMVIALSGIGLAQDESEQTVLKTGVKSRQQDTTQVQSSAVLPIVRPASVSTDAPLLPSSKLPQYRLAESEQFLNEQRKQDPLRFILQHGSELLVIQLELQIDGRTFTEARQQSVLKYLEALKQTPLESSSLKPPVPETVSVPEAAVSTKADDQTPESSSVSEPNGDEEKPAEATPPRVPPYRYAVETLERLQRYQAVNGPITDPEELNWLLTRWCEGPQFLLLDQSFQAFRSQQQPAWQVLDVNQDLVIDPEELKQAEQSLIMCDANRDQVITFDEIVSRARAVWTKTEVIRSAGTFWAWPSTVSANEMLERMRSRIDLPAETTLSDQPELLWRIHYQRSDESQSASELTFSSADWQNTTTENQQTFQLISSGLNLECSAIQWADSDQVAIGAVWDGYPLLPGLDPNGDGRMTIRELRKLNERLGQYDMNQDGRIELSEIRPTVRLCVSLGPSVHEELATIRGLIPEGSESVVRGPEWFVRMDRNQDGDLTRGEFPGTPEQFQMLDRDQDELISAREASESEAKSAE